MENTAPTLRHDIPDLWTSETGIAAPAEVMYQRTQLQQLSAAIGVQIIESRIPVGQLRQVALLATAFGHKCELDLPAAARGQLRAPPVATQPAGLLGCLQAGAAPHQHLCSIGFTFSAAKDRRVARSSSVRVEGGIPLAREGSEQPLAGRSCAPLGVETRGLGATAAETTTPWGDSPWDVLQALQKQRIHSQQQVVPPATLPSSESETGAAGTGGSRAVL